MQIEISDDGFLATVHTLEGGSLVDELDRSLIECVQAIHDRGGKAELTLKIKVARIPKMATAVSVVADVTTKVPKEDRAGSVLFVTNGSGLTFQHQKQESFDLGAPIAERTPPLTPIARIGERTNEPK